MSMANVKFFAYQLAKAFLEVCAGTGVRAGVGGLLLLIISSATHAATYNLSNNSYPPCSTSWSVSGTTYSCTGNGRVTLASGDILIANTNITISADNGFSLNNNTVGSAANKINLQSSYGTVNAIGTNTVNGNIAASGGQVNLNGTTVVGTLFTGGHIVLVGGSVSGQVTSSSNTITTTGTNLQGGARAQSGMSITGGLIAGDFVMTSNNVATFSGVTMTNGTISGASSVTITGNSSLGSPSAAVTITSTSGTITVTNNSTVYGTLTAPSYSTVAINNGGAVFGSCLPKSTPANACTPASTLLGSWRMDESYWTGVANEVIDSSGNHNHGRARIAAGTTPSATTAFNTPALTIGSQSTCSYGQFDSTTAPIRTHTYVELSGFPTLPSSFTFTAWIRSTNASAQHQRILVRDDAGNGWGLSLADGTGEPRLRFFNRNIQNSGAVTGQGRNPSCGVFCLDTNPILTNNAWHFIAATIDTSARKITLYVYSQSGTLLARTTGGYSGNWVDGTGTAAIGGETSASDEGRQNSFHFLGNIDEMEIYTGALSQSYIESLRSRVRTCPPIAPHHYELQVPADSIACMATPVTVVACANNSAPCTNAYLAAGGTTASLTTSTGVLANTTLSFNTAGVATTTLMHPTAADGTPVTVTLVGEQLGGSSPRHCCQGDSCSVANSCTTSFNSAGLAFATASAPNVASLPNQVAGLTDTTVILRAVRSDTSSTITGACEARVTGSRNVGLAFECRNPSTCIPGQALTLAGGQAKAINKDAAITYNNVALIFNNAGTAAMPLTYSDVGMLRLYARLPIAAVAAEPAIVLTGASADFVVKPHTLIVSSVPGNVGTTTSGAGFRAAGASFGARLEVRNANGQRTPNFGNEDPSARTNLSIEIGDLVYPAIGNPGTLTQTGEFTAVTPPGTFVHNNLRWDEVGSMTLTPQLAGDNYLGAGDVVAKVASATIGRFYPEEFVLADSSVTDACSGFSYMEQPFELSYRLEAHNQQGGVTSNYRVGYANLASPILYAENANNGINLGARLPLTIPSWELGSLALTMPNAVFQRQLSTLPDGPFGDLQFGVGLGGDGDNRALAGRNMDVNTSGSCVGNSCTAVMLGGAHVLRFGRLRLDDAFGPESVNLPVNFSTEFWSGSFFTQATTDSCTKIPRTAIKYPAGTIDTDGHRTVALSGGSTQGIYGNLQPTSIDFTAGNAEHFFSAPGVGTGSFEVEVDVTDFPWLRFDHNQDGDFNNDLTVHGQYGFGQYRGHDRIIYWREVFD